MLAYTPLVGFAYLAHMGASHYMPVMLCHAKIYFT